MSKGKGRGEKGRREERGGTKVWCGKERAGKVMQEVRRGERRGVQERRGEQNKEKGRRGEGSVVGEGIRGEERERRS